MASNATVRDSSITEQALAPHLRRRLGGGGRSYSVTSTAGVTAGNVALYQHSTDQSMTVAGWCSGVMVLSADTAVTSSALVTATEPWTFAGGEYSVRVAGTLALAPCIKAVVLAVRGAGVDYAATLLPNGAFDWTAPVTTGPVTLELRAVAMDPAGGEVVVSGLSVTVTG